MPDLIVITRDGAKKFFVSLKGGTAPPVSGGESGKGGGAMSRDAMSGVLAGVIQSKVGNVDPAQVQAFVKQPKLQFTIDCLVEEFAKFSSGARPGNQGATAAKKKKPKPRKPRTTGPDNGAAPAPAEGQ